MGLDLQEARIAYRDRTGKEIPGIRTYAVGSDQQSQFSKGMFSNPYVSLFILLISNSVL